MKNIILLILMLSILVSANDIENNELNYLKKYVGTYAINYIFSDKIIKKELHLLLKDKIKLLKENLSVIPPIDMIDGDIVISGIAPHQGGINMAIMDINTKRSVVTVAIYSEGNIFIYSKTNHYDYLPRSIKTQIVLWNTDFKVMYTIPKNVQMIINHKKIN